eukprot:TRINITY_DN2877_c0_g1_i2.p2 TRINITY_DN2877_c0_g1~~TRINITY_DN2877_c0_g1_i2.p2  ORF type:complete len:290 (+),score=132.14 TRINITY_DN2877_c0_g1_i2:63-932(+)
MASLTKKSENVCFGGRLAKYTHASASTNTDMVFSIYIPPHAAGAKLPVLYYLSGLTCTDDNVMQKSGCQRYAAEHGVIFVAPDTSPRGAGVEGEDEGWDFGTGAGFYVDATEAKWAKHYNMYSYVTKELPALIEKEFADVVAPGVKSITGHSMGGHGALVCAFKNPDQFASVSAFSAIGNPTKCPWGEKAFTGYLGGVEAGKAYDATELCNAHGPFPFPVLLDVGTGDSFLTGDVNQLQSSVLDAALKAKGQVYESRQQEGYDHSYFFIASFVGEHIAFHAKHLKAKMN